MGCCIRRCAIAAAIVCIALLVSACEQSQSSPATAETTLAERSRPAAVVADAVWVGGADGGVYVSISRNTNLSAGEYQGTVYTQSGDLWYRGRFVLEPAGAPTIDPKGTVEFSGWDGDTLYLTDGRRLVARDPEQGR